MWLVATLLDGRALEFWPWTWLFHSLEEEFHHDHQPQHPTHPTHILPWDPPSLPCLQCFPVWLCEGRPPLCLRLSARSLTEWTSRSCLLRSTHITHSTTLDAWTQLLQFFPHNSGAFLHAHLQTPPLLRPQESNFCPETPACKVAPEAVTSGQSKSILFTSFPMCSCCVKLPSHSTEEDPGELDPAPT